jgi:hypothetical protein
MTIKPELLERVGETPNSSRSKEKVGFNRDLRSCELRLAAATCNGLFFSTNNSQEMEMEKEAMYKYIMIYDATKKLVSILFASGRFYKQ